MNTKYGSANNRLSTELTPEVGSEFRDEKETENTYAERDGSNDTPPNWRESIQQTFMLSRSF